MDQLTVDITPLTQAARDGARMLRQATSARKNAALEAIAQALMDRSEEILAANAADYQRGEERGIAPGLLDRLKLTDERIEAIAAAIRHVIGLPDPVGEVIMGATTELGLRVRQMRVPMGVVGMIYEARPNVTVDAATLALKAGNAVILRGGSAAEASNEALIRVMREALESVEFPPDLIQTVDPWGREGARALMRARGGIDVLIPRGGAALIQTVVEESRVPVIETGTGNCHVYVDDGADLQAAERIILNAKTQRVGVCNAAETLLVHSAVAEEFLPSALAALTRVGVTIHADERAGDIARRSNDIDHALIVDATEDDWATEYLSMDLAVRIVDSIDEAIDHIRTYSTGHTEAICTRSLASARRFESGVDCAAIAVNASTRFTDGGQLGLGAEIGISTQKLHARGPMGLTELTTTTWIIEGEGTVRP
ncbi:glutamate-5-semialdehyde dehydrogenase [Schaalia sp. ZJ405]|uniref:glutamate-5-semialdehyde dehydrogenase n=1 Tax=Schaalia sp. ZJ405 TaxID=2709403 RepID=UPI0013ED6364|nr:glutamate-5-semialdehyde dehydrogenase [Schaalia sp. ZJ405]QPK81908.1 glutamate-5-semialdehyde dehydrogenase [Schaalia sp. ZJ405]